MATDELEPVSQDARAGMETRFPDEVADDELLERFLPKAHVRNDGTLKWQAVKMTEKDKGGGLSVGRLLAGVPTLIEEGNKAIRAGLFGFGETSAGTMRGEKHEVKATPSENFPAHAEIMLSGLDPTWPVPYEPNDPTPEGLAMVDYYFNLLRFFRFRPLDEEEAPAA